MRGKEESKGRQEPSLSTQVPVGPKHQGDTQPVPDMRAGLPMPTHLEESGLRNQAGWGSASALLFSGHVNTGRWLRCLFLVASISFQREKAQQHTHHVPAAGDTPAKERVKHSCIRGTRLSWDDDSNNPTVRAWERITGAGTQ